MRLNIVILIIAEIIWLTVEGGLILRDKARSRGTTKADRMSRMFNTVSIGVALSSVWPSLLLPELRFGGDEILAITLAGTLLIILGLALRYWSIIILGRYFRTTVELEEGQKVVRSGPYRFIRHPSYSGIILFCVGYGLVSQNWLSFSLCALLPAAALLYRIKIEEEEMAKGMGTEYTEYQSKTKKLIPGIW
jgi:protein-S-isoprenylcysteine O-methyltransferase Ste14